MTWVTIHNSVIWEFDNDPPDPENGQTGLWTKQTNGIRVNANGDAVYTKCRRIGTTVDTIGEQSKSFWDAQGTDDDIPIGYVNLIDDVGNYITDDLGNFIIVPEN